MAYMDDKAKTTRKAQIMAARRDGGRIFFWANGFLIAIAFAILYEGMFLNWLDEQRYSFPNGRSIFYDLTKGNEETYVTISGFAAVFMYMVASWAAGRRAGQAIQVGKRGFGWAAPLWMTVPCMLGVATAISSYFLQDPVSLDEVMRRWDIALMVCGMCVFLVCMPTLGMSFLAGLVLRQAGRQRDEAAARLPRPEPAATSESDAASLAVQLRRARRIGMGTYAVLAAILLVVYMPLEIFLWAEFAFDKYRHLIMTTSVLGGILLLMGITLIGRFVGPNIRLRHLHYGWVGPSLLLPLALLVGVTVMGYLYWADEFGYNHWRLDAWDFFIVPGLQVAMAAYLPAAILSVPAGLFLRHYRVDAPEADLPHYDDRLEWPMNRPTSD